MQPISLSQSMQLLPCTPYQICRCCYATNITQLKNATVAMHTIPNMNCCYATNITQLKNATVAMHTIPNMNCCYATNITQLEHTAIIMHTKPSMHLLLCNQYHTSKTCSCCHVHNTTGETIAMQTMSHSIHKNFRHVHMLPSQEYNSKFSWSNVCNFCKINQNHRIFHHENLLMELLSIHRA